MTRKLLQLSAAVAAAGILLAGCSSVEDQTAASSSSDDNSTAASDPAGGAAQQAVEQATAAAPAFTAPGPAVEGVTLDMAPAESQQVINEFGRADYGDLIGSYPTVLPLSNTAMGAMFDKWDREIGAGMIKE